MVLGVAAALDARADPDHAAVRRPLAGQQREQHRLPGAVRADDADALAVLDDEVGVPNDRPPLQTDARALEPDRDRPATDPRTERQRHPPPLQDRPLHLVHAVDLPLLVPGLLDMAFIDDDACPELEPFHGGLEPRDLLLL